VTSCNISSKPFEPLLHPWSEWKRGYISSNRCAGVLSCRSAHSLAAHILGCFRWTATHRQVSTLYLSLLTVVPSDINSWCAMTSVTFLLSNPARMYLFLVNYCLLWVSYKTYLVLSLLTIFQSKSGSLSAALVNSTQILIQLSQCSCISIFGKMCWQMHSIFKSLMRMVWQIWIKIPTSSTIISSVQWLC